MSLVFHISKLLLWLSALLQLLSKTDWKREGTGRRGRRREHCGTTFRERKYTESWKCKQSHYGELTWKKAMDLSWDKLHYLWRTLVNM